MKKSFKRGLAAVLSFALCFSMLNLTVLAADDQSTENCPHVNRRYVPIGEEGHVVKCIDCDYQDPKTFAVAHEIGHSSENNYAEGDECVRTCYWCGYEMYRGKHTDINGSVYEKHDHSCDYCHTPMGWIQVVSKEPATCTTTGLITYRCEYGEKCAIHDKPETIPTLEPQWGEKCTIEDGVHYKVCTACNGDADGHEVKCGAEVIVDNQPDCVNKGNSHTICLECEQTISNSSSNELGHKFPETWTDDGNGKSHSHICEQCENKLDGGIETKDHVWGAWSLVEGSFTDWVQDPDDENFMIRTATVERFCNDCPAKDTATIEDPKDLKDQLRRAKGEKAVDVYYLVLNGGTSTDSLGGYTVKLKETDEPVEVEIKDFEGYTVARIDCKTIAYDEIDKMPSANGKNPVVHVYYTRNSYTLTINYVDEQGNERAGTHTEPVAYEAKYSVDSPAVDGYTADQNTVSGTMPANDVKVTVTYTANPVTPNPNPNPNPDPNPGPVVNPEPPVEIEEPDVPLVDEPTPAEDPVEIDEPDVPLAEDPDVEIDEPDVPLADVPKTGDVSLIWEAVALASGTGLAGLAFGKKKRKDSEEE